MRYFVKTPWLLKKLYPGRTWNFDRNEKVIYLTFDDGPHPAITPFILELLKKYEARATFFCIGRNVQENRAVYQQILEAGHAVGNHSQNHLNGFHSPAADYEADVREASKNILSRLFRPPYGRMTTKQARRLRDFRIVMWDVLSGDFDGRITPGQCADRVIRRAKAGSIVVFHDSEKAWKNLAHSLPLVLENFSRSGFRFSVIPPVSEAGRPL